MTADVISLPKSLDALAERIRVSYARTENGRREWIEGTLELAAALAEARGRFPSNGGFAAWLGMNELDWIGKNDRAALISMADDLATTRRVLDETKSTSWQIIWRDEVEPRLPNARNIHVQTEIVENPPPAPVITQQEQLECAGNRPTSSVYVRRNSPFYGLERAGEVFAMYCAKTRACLGGALNHKNKKEIWSLVLLAIDQGFLTPTKAVIEKPHLRLLFPGVPSKYGGTFDLTDTADRHRIRDEIMPIAIANREALLAAPDQLESIVAAHRQRQLDAVRESVGKQKITAALQAMPPEQREVIMFGVRLWPRVGHQFGTYEYKQLCGAVWYFRDFEAWLQGSKSGATPGSRAIITRLNTRWPHEYMDMDCPPDETRGKMKKFYQLIQLLARLLEENPTGECIAPPSPKIEGQW